MSRRDPHSKPFLMDATITSKSECKNFAVSRSLSPKAFVLLLRAPWTNATTVSGPEF